MVGRYSFAIVCSFTYNALQCQSSDEQRILHLSVQPSAWTSGPPGSREASPSSHRVSSTPPVSSQPCATPPRPPTDPVSDDTLAFIRLKHWQALYILSNSKICPPQHIPDIQEKRSLVKLALEGRGYAWPAILDSDYPPSAPTTQGHVDYDIVTVR